MGVVYELPKKWRCPESPPNSTHCSLTKKRALQAWTMKSLWFVAKATKRPSGRATHKKGEVPPPPPNRTHCPPHQQGNVYCDGGGSNQRSSEIQTTAGVKGHTQKRRVPIPSPVDAFIPSERDLLIFPPDGPWRHP